MQSVTQQKTEAKITEQTFIDLGMWLTHPNEYNVQQLATLLDEDDRLPLITLVNSYWPGGALHNSLKDSNVWQKLDLELQNYLAELEQFYNQRNQGIKQEAIFACQLLTNANIPVVILKGGASLFNGVFTPISNRFMTDVDLLVPENLQEKANEVLINNNYTPNIEKHWHIPVGHHHAPALFRKEGGHCCVELHRWVLMKSVSDILTTEEVWQHAIPLALTDSLIVQQMEPNQQVVLSVAHSELSHTGFEDKHIDWRQLFNLYALAKHHTNNINWPNVQQHFTRCNKPESFNALMYAAYKFFKLTTPVTNSQNINAKKQIEKCIALFVKRQSPNHRFSYLREILTGYNKENIKVAYGQTGSFPIFTGRLKHLKRHLIMLSKPKFLIRFIKRIFN